MLTISLIGGAAVFIAGGAWFIKRQIEREVDNIKSYGSVESTSNEWRTLVTCRMGIEATKDKSIRLHDSVFLLQIRGDERRVQLSVADQRVTESSVENLWLSTRAYNEIVLPWLEGTYSNKQLTIEAEIAANSVGSVSFKAVGRSLV